jgi:hypothetical protein
MNCFGFLVVDVFYEVEREFLGEFEEKQYATLYKCAISYLGYKYRSKIGSISNLNNPLYHSNPASTLTFTIFLW